MLLKKAHENKLVVPENLKDQITFREISRTSGISLSGYYYRSRESHVENALQELHPDRGFIGMFGLQPLSVSL